VTATPAPGGASPAPLSPTLEDACRRWPERPALTFGGETTSYATLWQRVMSLAGAYERLGVGRGDRILCQLRNCPEHIVATGAAWLRGAVHVGADNDLTGAELSRLVERLDARVLLFGPSLARPGDLDALATVAAEHPATHIIVHAADAGAHQALGELLSSHAPVEPVPTDPLDPALIFLTSGTTGEAKAVVEPRAAHWAKMQLFADAFRPTSDDVHLLYLPISHVFGSRLAMLALLRGGRLVLSERFSPQRTLELVAEEGVTVLPGVPTHLRLLRDRFDPAVHDASSLRWVLSAAANLPRPLAEWVYDELGADITYVYGCSEGFTMVTAQREQILAGSVGTTVFRGPPGTPADGTVRIAGPDGATVAPGEIGEIVYGAAVPVRYWDHPDAATDGWYRTGDLGRMDSDGAVYIVGRLKELVNRGGLHVSMAEVELALLLHPGVADAGVIAAPDETLGEAVCACIAAAGGPAPTLAELREFLGERLARHKLPDELCVVDAIPRTDIGKVDRRELRARVIDGGVPRERLRGAPASPSR
jgi:acyl-CoA synthetase (AMP-forming)/AMP-acid ligase II